MKSPCSQSIDWLTDWLTDWLIDWLTLTDWLIDWLIDSDWLTDWLTDRPTDWLTEWMTDWLSDWLIGVVNGKWKTTRLAFFSVRPRLRSQIDFTKSWDCETFGTTRKKDCETCEIWLKFARPLFFQWPLTTCIDRLIDWLIDSNCLTDWLTDWLTV